MKPTSTTFQSTRERRRWTRAEAQARASAAAETGGVSPEAFAEARTHALRRSLMADQDPAATASPKRRRWFTMAMTLALLAALSVWLGGFAGAVAETLRAQAEARLLAAGFVFETLDVRGAVRTSPPDIEQALGVPLGALVFDLDPKAARDRIEALPWVREAAVLRLLPDRVVVVVVEHAPLARWREEADSPTLLVDDWGAVLRADVGEAHGALPLIVGQNAPVAAPELMAALVERPRLQRLARSFEWVGDRRWDVHLHTGGVVRLPEGPAALVFARLAQIDARTGFLETNLDIIDLRNGLRLRPPAHLSRTHVRERGA